MTDWLDNGWSELGLAAAALVVVAWIGGFVWERLVAPLILGEGEGELDRRLARRAALPLQLILVSAGTRSALLDIEERREAIRRAVPTPYLSGFLLILSILAGAWLISRIVEGIVAWSLERAGAPGGARIDQQAMPLVRRAIRGVMLFVALTVILGHYDVKITALLGAAGVASLAVALAAQESVANVIGGLTIMIDRPFRLGDRIELPTGKTGTVRFIGLRSTRIQTPERSTIVIPNAELVKQAVINHDHPDPSTTVRQPLGVAYGTDVDRAKRVLLDVLAAHPKVLADPAPAVLLAEFGDSALGLQLVYTIEREQDRPVVSDEINAAVLKALAAASIELPFPQRVVHLKREG